MAQAYPDLYAAAGVHSGLACGAARDLASALRRDAARRGRPRTLPAAAGSGASCPPSCSMATATARCIRATATQVIAHSRGGERVADRDAGRKVPGGHAYTRTVHADAAGRAVLEHWLVQGAGHAWSGGSPAGSYTDPRGPDASREMLRFFLSQRGSGFPAGPGGPG